MYNLDKASNDIAIKLKNELNLDNDNYEIVKYGLYAFFHMILSIIIIGIFGAIFGVFLESLIISFAVAILRKSSGGVHASTELNCIIVGVMISVIPSLILVNIEVNVINTVIFCALAFSIVTFLIYKLAPVDTPNKPIKSQKKIKRLRRVSFITLGIYTILVFVSLYLGIKMESQNLLKYSLCISFGSLWQGLTLTKLGNIVLNIMDSLLINILKMGGKLE